MTNTQSKLFSTSRPKPNGANGSLQQTILLPAPYDETIRNLIKDKTICALSFINSDRVLQHQFGPLTLPEVDGSSPKTSVGNSQDKIGWYAPFSINLEDSHFLAMMSEADMDLYGLPKPQPLPEPICAAHGLNGNNYLVATPKYVPGHFGFEFPSGPIDEVAEQFESNGPAYEAWDRAGMSADTRDKQDTIARIYRHATIQAALDTYILNRPANLSLEGPAVTATSGTFQAYPNQMEELQRMMLPKNPPPEKSAFSSSAAANLTTGEDRQKDFISNRGLLKLVVQCVGGNVDFDACKIDAASLVRPIETTSFSNLKSAPSGSRPDMFCDYVNHSIDDIRKNGDSMNALSHISLRVLSLDTCKLFLTGGFQAELLSEIHDEKQLSSIGASTFMPQDLDEGLITKYVQDEAGERNARNANVGTPTTKKIRTALVSLAKMEDRSASKILINCKTVYRILFDLAAMDDRNTPSVYDQIKMHVLEWLTTQVEQKNASWIRSTKKGMDHLKFVYFTIVDMMMVAFAKFGTSLNNLQIIEDPNGDLSQLDTSEIVTFLKAIKNQKERFAYLQSVLAPHEDVPAIAPVSRPEVSTVQNATASPPAPARQQKQQQQHPIEQQRAQKKQKIDSPASTTMANAGGIITLYEGKSPGDAVPASLSICPDFACKGHHCPHKDRCGKLHPIKLKDIPARERTTLAKHLQQSKAGYINFWKVKGVDIDSPEYEGIVGTTTKPPQRA